MKIVILSLMMAFLATASLAGETTAELLNGKIVVQSPEGTKALDYSEKEKYVPLSLNKWKVKRESQLIKQALEVYKKKSIPIYSERVWIINKEDGSDQFYVEYQSREGDEKILFSDDETHGYYLGLSQDGISVVYGIDLLSKKTTPIAEADDFWMTRCDNNQLNYLILQRDGVENTYFIYTTQGDAQKEITYSGSIEDLNDVVCY